MGNVQLISVIMPAFNAESFIADSIESVLAQSFSNFELLVIDDGSTDGTASIIDWFVSKDPRVFSLNNMRTKGVSGARNTGISEARGAWVAFLDSDDIWFPGTLEQRVFVVNRYPNCDVITSDYNIWFPDNDDAEVSISSVNPVWAKYFSASNKSGESFEMFKPIGAFIESALTHTSVIMIKTELLRSLDGFDESLYTYEDVFLWLKLSAYSDCIVYIPVVGSRYRQRIGSLTHSGDPETKGAVDVFRKLLNDPAFQGHRAILKSEIRHHLVLNTYWYRNNGHKLKAIRSALASFVAAPWNQETLKNLVASLLFR
ncbi:hypothetical protein ABA45_10365 [Marinobacter psychrophilus]|uniref:Glycosyltransferase 2-like domain-containing protein n=1 Tax=Marinobacter psychrophilus TaxID=330734 RepID=A0A0H4I4T5_9GAMM|nr:glycosyltransferase family 2 protein [Marinobacter psychrophilus]AKO52758.1 hypothetical protein ABA45_10365 [Marinobacter psychrophilus]